MYYIIIMIIIVLKEQYCRPSQLNDFFKSQMIVYGEITE